MPVRSFDTDSSSWLTIKQVLCDVVPAIELRMEAYENIARALIMKSEQEAWFYLAKTEKYLVWFDKGKSLIHLTSHDFIQKGE
jgi:hypothetical protein